MKIKVKRLKHLIREAYSYSYKDKNGEQLKVGDTVHVRGLGTGIVRSFSSYGFDLGIKGDGTYLIDQHRRSMVTKKDDWQDRLQVVGEGSSHWDGRLGNLRAPHQGRQGDSSFAAPNMRKKKKSPQKCNFDDRAMSFAAREMGCPLDHCECGTHDADCIEHQCDRDFQEEDPMGDYVRGYY